MTDEYQSLIDATNGDCSEHVGSNDQGAGGHQGGDDRAGPSLYAGGCDGAAV